MSTSSNIVIKSNENTPIFINNPSITYFKSVYRKHTKFAIVYNKFNVSDGARFSDTNNELIIPLRFDGDLISKIYLNIDINEPSNLTPTTYESDFPLLSLNKIKFNLQGKNLIIDELTAESINFQGMLENPTSMEPVYNINGGEISCINGNNYQNMSLCGGIKSISSAVIKKMSAKIPLPFAFCRSIGNSFPLCCLNMSNILPQLIINKSPNFRFNDVDSLNTSIYNSLRYSAEVKYILLSDEEKLRFKNNSQEYLYEKTYLFNNDNPEITNNTYGNNEIPISNTLSNHPIKNIYIVNSNDNFSEINYNVLINKQYIYTDNLNNSFLSKIPILEHFKGSIYKDNKIHNNISIINFSLSQKYGPSGCINTSSNQVKIKVDNKGLSYNIKIYIVYYYMLFINDGEISYLFD